jgi:hypothetical protein
MGSRKFYRDSIEEEIVGKIKTSVTSDGHTIERYTTKNGKKKYFATLSGTHWCAHGDTVAQAVSDAIWKDPLRRPSLEALVEEIRKEGKKRPITLNEFRILTGACISGCREALSRAGRDESPMTAYDVRDVINKEWGDKLLSVLGWTS